MSNLVKYEAARLALAECKTFDEAKSWVDKAEAMRAYGRIAKDKTMEVDAAEIRLRAERRLGEMLIEQKETLGLNKGGNPNLTGSKSEPVVIPTLEQAGIDKKLSMRSQQYASVPSEEFDAIVANWRDKVSEQGVRVSLQLHPVSPAPVKKVAPKSESAPVNLGIVAKLNETIVQQQERIAALEAERETMVDALDELALSHETIQLLQTDTAKTIRNLLEQIRVLETRRDGLMNEKNEYMKICKSLQKKLDKKNAA